MTNDAAHSYAYDAEGNLVLVDGGGTAQYVYDVFNHRIREQTTSGTTEYIYDAGGRRVSSWLPSTNTATEGRIYWGGTQVAFRSSDGTTYFDHQEMTGTERMRTNYAGSVGSSYLSLPWGDGYAATVNSSGADQDNGHFAGLELDAESGTEHAQFRNYASAQGRWLSPDPYMGSYDFTNPQSMNRYAYALNNPVSLVDPSGLTPQCTIDPDTDIEQCTSDYPSCTTDPDASGCNSGGSGGCVSSGAQGCIPSSCASIYGCSGPPPSGPSSGSGGGMASPGAPSNGIPWYKNPCVQSALAKGAASTAIDAVGLLPEGGAVAGAFSLWHGAAGVSNGINILSRVQFGPQSSPLPAPGPMPRRMVPFHLPVPRSPLASHQLGLVSQRPRRLLGKLFPQRRS